MVDHVREAGLDGRHVVVAISGSVAAYKGADLVRQVIHRGAAVRVILTRAAACFVQPRLLEALSGYPVASDLFHRGPSVDHIELARWADAAVVAPATADVLSTTANGLAPDFLGTWLLAFPGPVLFAPAMNRWMWAHPAIQRNVDRLRADGYHFCGPDYGEAASPEEGIGWGRLADPRRIVAALEDVVVAPLRSLDLPGWLVGRRVLVTAGPTREAIDPVRFLSNPSSGRMGWAVAEAARDMGADVTLVAGPSEQAPPAGIRCHRVVTTEEMLAQALAVFDQCDLVVAAAAPADWRPQRAYETKVRKSEVGPEWGLALVPTPDVIGTLGARKIRQVLVGFAAEAGAGLESARQKLVSKHLDLIAYNDVTEPGAGFASERNHVFLLDRAGGVEEIGPASKRVVAERLLARAAVLLGQ